MSCNKHRMRGRRPHFKVDFNGHSPLWYAPHQPSSRLSSVLKPSVYLFNGANAIKRQPPRLPNAQTTIKQSTEIYYGGSLAHESESLWPEFIQHEKEKSTDGIRRKGFLVTIGLDCLICIGLLERDHDADLLREVQGWQKAVLEGFWKQNPF
jgi:hypothetical protein